MTKKFHEKIAVNLGKLSNKKKTPLETLISAVSSP
jgi:hypothetical protein